MADIKLSADPLGSLANHTNFIYSIQNGVNKRIHKPPFRNVRDFGAKADGSDDTAAIQAAIDYTNSPSGTPQGAGTVYFPPGVYTITSPIDLATVFANSNNNNSICLLGEGGASRIQGNFAGYLIKNSIDPGPYAGGGRISNLTFANPHDAGGCVHTGAVIGWTIDNCSFNGHVCLDTYSVGGDGTGGHQIGGNANQSCTVQGCVFTGGQTISIGILCGEGTAVIGCDFTGMTYAIVARAGLSVASCRFEVNTVGITFGAQRASLVAGAPPSTIIQANGAGQSFVTASTFESCLTGIDILGATGAVVFAALSIHGGMDYGIRTRGQLHDSTFIGVHNGGGQNICGIQVSPYSEETTNLIFINCTSASNGVNSWDIDGNSPGSFAIGAADAIFTRCIGDDAMPFQPVWTFAKLPTTKRSKGEQYFITDANTSTLGANVTAGGGSTNGYVVWNGSNWTLASK